MRLAALQMHARCGDVEANLARIELAAKEASLAGATLLVAPELALTGYGAGDEMAALACTTQDAPVARVRQVAEATKVAIVAGFAEREGAAIYNSAVHADWNGSSTVYRKSHLYGEYERSLFHAGEPCAAIFDHLGTGCGLLICYDVEFPENVRRLAMAGADLVLVPTALPAGSSGRFITEHMIRTRAFENQIFVAYVDLCGSDPLFDFAGSSMIAAPDGTILAAANETDEALLVADIKPEDYAQSRKQNTYLADLRPRQGPS